MTLPNRSTSAASGDLPVLSEGGHMEIVEIARPESEIANMGEGKTMGGG